ncbi:MAG: hypothetical protein N3G19_02500, partial [Candidatus Pacearchaeota archaeon]|nr:hypothetical protein [Candidatus Pacearchaeota archaeon]
MAIKKRSINVHKSHKDFKRNDREPALEKIVLVLFLVFVIIATVILFKVPTSTQYVPTTGKALASVNLEKAEYNASERLKGTITLQMEQPDVLPKETKFEIFISTNVPECQLKYICPNGISIDWHSYDPATGTCNTINSDPESTCCFLMGSACIQVILNSKFNDIDLGSPNWYALPFGTNPTAIGVEDFIDPVTSNVTLEKALFLDTTDIAYTIPNTTATAYQLLLNRQFAVKELRESAEYIAIEAPPGLYPFWIKNGTNVTYRAKMFLWGQEASGASFSWELIQDGNVPIGYLNSTTGQDIQFSATAKGTATLKVTATSQGRTVTTFRSICVWLNDVIIECGYTSPIEVFSSDTKDIDKGLILKFDSTAQEQKELKKELYFQAPPTAQRGEMKWTLAYITTTPIIQSTGCAFEVIVKGKNATNESFVRTLHYWYKVPTAISPYCNKPQDTPTDKYIDLSSQLPPQTKAKNFSIDLYSNWTSAFGAGSQNDIIYEIYLVSRGFWEQTTNLIHGQRVYFDNVELRKYSATPEPSLNCTARGKACCPKGSGLGNYLGDQLNCPEETHKCYDRCAPSLLPIRNFEGFKALSSTSTKFNRTTEKCKVLVEGAGKLVALGTSDPLSTELFINPYRKLYKGKALAIVK